MNINELEPRDEYRQSQVTLSNAHAAQANERVGRTLSDDQSKREIAKMLKVDINPTMSINQGNKDYKKIIKRKKK